jgi:hypothetical protein
MHYSAISALQPQYYITALGQGRSPVHLEETCTIFQDGLVIITGLAGEWVEKFSSRELEKSPLVVGNYVSAK